MTEREPEGAAIERSPQGSTMPRGSHPGDLRSLARGGTLNLVGSVASAVLGFVLVLVVDRGFGSNVAAASAFFSAVALFTLVFNTAELGADTGLVRFIARLRTLGRAGDIRPTVWTALVPTFIAGALASALVWMLADPLAHVFTQSLGGQTHVDQFVTYLRVFAPFLLVASASSVLLQGCRGFGTMLPFVTVENIGKPAASAAMVLVVVLAGLGGTALALAWGIPTGVGFVVALVWMLRLIGREERTSGQVRQTESTSKLAREFWRFSAPRALAGFFQISITYLDVLLVGALAPQGPTGKTTVYFAVSRMVTVGTFGLQAIRLAIAPQLSSLLSRGEHDRAQRLYQVATWWLIALSWPLYIGLAVFAPLVLGIFGRSYATGQTSLVILSIAMLVNLGTGNVTVVLLMGGKSAWNLFNAAGALVLNIVLNVYLIPRYGFNGAAVAWSVSIIFDNAASVVEVWLLLGLRPFGSSYLLAAGLPLACFGLVGLVVRAVLGEGWLALVAYGVVAAGLYLPLLWRFREALHLDELYRAFRPMAGADGPPSG
jgi:O-antigen/teichoic acid export membrane protein